MKHTEPQTLQVKNKLNFQDSHYSTFQQFTNISTKTRRMLMKHTAPFKCKNYAPKKKKVLCKQGSWTFCFQAIGPLKTEVLCKRSGCNQYFTIPRHA